MDKEFDYKLIDKFPGYNSASDKTTLPPGYLTRGSKNCIKNLRGNVESRCGLKRRGSVDDTEAGVKSDYVWNTNVGTTRPLRVCNGKLEVESDIIDEGEYVWYELFDTLTSGSILTVTVSDPGTSWTGTVGIPLTFTGGNGSGGTGIVASVSGDLLTGVTVVTPGWNYQVGDVLNIDGFFGQVTVASISSVTTSLASSLTRFVFDTWWDNDELSDRLIFVRGDEYILSWSGGIASVQSATVSTITKTGTESWAEVGFATNLSNEKYIRIDGRLFRYTGGEGTTTLTGVTTESGLVSDLVGGEVAIQSVIVSEVPDIEGYNFDFIKTVNNQVWAGSYSSRIVYISADTTAGGVLGFLNFVDSSSHVSGDPDNIVMDNQVKGIGVQDGFVILFAGESDMYVVTPNQNVTFAYTGSDGLTRYNFQKIEKKKLNGLSAALGHEFIDNFSGHLVWIDQNNQLRAHGTFSNLDSIIPVNLSLAVEEELSQEDFTGGHLKAVGDSLRITAPNTGRDWIYENREVIDETGQIISEKFWQPPQVRSISRFSVINGVTFGHSNSNPQIYQIEDTGQWFDDDPSEEEIPYMTVMLFSYQNHGRKQGKIVFDGIFFEGYMMRGTEVNGYVLIDYRGSTDIKEITLSNDVSLASFFGAISPSLGDSFLGGNPLGDGILEELNERELVPKFRVVTRIMQPKNCYEYSIALYSNGTDKRWEIVTFGTNSRVASETPFKLKKGL